MEEKGKRAFYITPPKEGETGILVSGDYEKSFANYMKTTTEAGAGSNLDLFLYFFFMNKKRASAKKYPANKCLGFRKKKDGIDTGYFWWNYEEVAQMAFRLAKVIEHEKLYSEVFDAGKKLKIMLAQIQKVQVEQIIVLLALWHCGAAIMSEIDEFRTDPELHTLASSGEDLSRLIELKQSGLMPNIKTLLIIDQEAKDSDIKKAQELKLRLLFLYELVKNDPYPGETIILSGSRRDDVAILIETSGTTGFEKVFLLIILLNNSWLLSLMKSLFSALLIGLSQSWLLGIFSNNLKPV